MTENMDMESTVGQMERNMMVIGNKANNMVKQNIHVTKVT